MDERPDGMAEWFSPDIAARFGRLHHHPMVRTSPPIDVAEIGSMLIITADVPGVRKDNLHLDVEHGVLVIQGEMRAESRVNEESYIRIERNLGNYYRRVPLPFEPHVEEIKATLTDGVLEVRIPEPPQKQAEPRVVSVDQAPSAIEPIVRGALPVGGPSPESV